MSYEKLKSFSQRNLLYTDSSGGGGRSQRLPPGYASGLGSGDEGGHSSSNQKDLKLFLHQIWTVLAVWEVAPSCLSVTPSFPITEFDESFCSHEFFGVFLILGIQLPVSLKRFTAFSTSERLTCFFNDF